MLPLSLKNTTLSLFIMTMKLVLLVTKTIQALLITMLTITVLPLLIMLTKSVLRITTIILALHPTKSTMDKLLFTMKLLLVVNFLPNRFQSKNLLQSTSRWSISVPGVRKLVCKKTDEIQEGSEDIRHAQK